MSMPFHYLMGSTLLGCIASTAAPNPRFEFACGVLAESRGKPDRAHEHFENARRLDPAAAPLVERAVAHLMAAGNRTDAIRLHRELAAARPDDLAIQLAHADFLTDLGRGDALATKLATETLDAALAKYPGHPEIIRRLFSIHQNKGNSSRAAELAEMLADDEPASVLLFASLTRTLHDSDDADAQAKIAHRYQLALTQHPENATLVREASEHFRKTGNREQAIKVLKRHTEAAPWSLDLRVRLGILQFAAKHNNDGEKTLLDVLQIHPRHALAHQSLAKFYRLKGDLSTAANHSGELLKIRGGDPSEFLKLAAEYLAAKRPRDARLLLEKAVFDHPDHLELRMKLAIASHLDPATRPHSSRLFRAAEAAAPDGRISDPAFLSTSAEVLIESGQSRAAEERLRAAIRAYPPEAKTETAATLRRLAQLWESENRNPEAARALHQRANALDPP